MGCTIDIGLIERPAVYVPAPALVMGGGEAVFLGRTRGEVHPEFGRLVALEYEAYAGMAEKRLRELATVVAAEQSALHIFLRHTVGRVPVGAASVFIQVLCPHRKQAFAGCSFLIDELKVDVPIWKREVYG